MSLRAPVAVAVELRGPERRVFRLAESVGEDGVRLEKPAPFDIGRPVEIGFLLPDASARILARAEVRLGDDDDEEHGGRELLFLHPDEETRAALRRYVTERLSLPASGRD